MTLYRNSIIFPIVTVYRLTTVIIYSTAYRLPIWIAYKISYKCINAVYILVFPVCVELTKPSQNLSHTSIVALVPLLPILGCQTHTPEIYGEVHICATNFVQTFSHLEKKT